MATFTVQPVMRINLPHAKELAHELCNLPTPDVPSLSMPDGTNFDIHHAISTALSTYGRNLTALANTAETLGHSTLNSLSDIEDTDAQLARSLEQLT